ncbi:MAG TPA: aromatic ring-hydroxylating dioxygenase subunit alpha, partial [Polyangiaceae bacterium]
MSDAPFLVPKERYTSPAFHALEWERLWTKSWLLAGRSADLEKVGDYFVFEIGAESIVVVKSGPDSVHAFYNVCPHRGTRLVSEARGSFECVRCPYHAWEWRLDGRLKRVSDAGSFPPGTKASELSLYAVQAATWLGFVFVNLDPDAEPLAAALAELTPLLEPYLLERHVLVRDVTVEWDCNWKVCMDNSNETYHVQSVHPQLLELLD